MIKYNIGWGITNACNMNCQFCYSKETRHNIDNVSLSDWIKFVDDNYQQIDSINYGTGENAICDEFFEFINYVRTKYPSITQSLTTNGYLYEKVNKSKRWYDIYKKSIDEVDVSLDFGNKEMHNIFRGQPKAYDWAINTLAMLKKDHKKTTIVFVGFEETMKPANIDSLFDIANQYNALIRINIYRPVSESECINKKYILSYNTLKKGLEYMISNYEVVSLNDILLGNIYTEGSPIVENTGINSIRILPDGSICPSTYLIDENYRSKYNIKQEKVLSKLSFEQFIQAPIPKECNNCEIVDKCRGGVYDRRLLWFNTLDHRDPYCPFENDNALTHNKVKVKKMERISVHDGYLPTMFFKGRDL